METDRIEFFRQLLQQRLADLIGEADKTRTDMTGAASPFPDPTDRATLETDRNFTLRIRDRERKLIAKIREAMERLLDAAERLVAEDQAIAAVRRPERRRRDELRVREADAAVLRQPPQGDEALGAGVRLLQPDPRAAEDLEERVAVRVKLDPAVDDQFQGRPDLSDG